MKKGEREREQKHLTGIKGQQCNRSVVRQSFVYSK